MFEKTFHRSADLSISKRLKAIQNLVTTTKCLKRDEIHWKFINGIPNGVECGFEISHLQLMKLIEGCIHKLFNFLCRVKDISFWISLEFRILSKAESYWHSNKNAVFDIFYNFNHKTKCMMKKSYVKIQCLFQWHVMELKCVKIWRRYQAAWIANETEFD